MANRRFTSIDNDHTLVFDCNSSIEEAEDDASIAGQGFCFTKIKEISEFDQVRTVDVIGICSEVGQIISVNLKSGMTKERRNIQIGDEDGLSIQVSIWGNPSKTTF